MERSFPYEKPSEDELEGRWLPTVVTFLNPFRIVVRDHVQEQWSTSIQQINDRAWDYVSLHELVGGLDVGMTPNLHLVVGADGALALPACQETAPVESAITILNRTLAAILLGGVYCEAVGLADIGQGTILDWRYLRVHPLSGKRPAASASLSFHCWARTLRTPADVAVHLIEPPKLPYRDLYNAHQSGKQVLDAVPTLSADILLKGVSAIAHREWSAALSNLAITSEQITGHLWRTEVAEKETGAPPIEGRKKQLADTRTWTAAARQEVLFQLGAITSDTLHTLFKARRARNNLAHEGRAPQECDAQAALEAIRGLLERALAGNVPKMFSIDLSQQALPGPYDPLETEPIEPTHWLEIPQLPGEADANRAHRRWLAERRKAHREHPEHSS